MAKSIKKVSAKRKKGESASPLPTAKRTSDARAFAIEVARLCQNTRCHSVVVLDASGISPVTDFLVIATGTSARQMRTVVDDVAELGEKSGFRPYGSPDTESDSWLLVDFVHVVVHVFSQESRVYYDLDSLWGDAKRVEWE